MKIKNGIEKLIRRIPVKTYTDKDETVRKKIFEAFEKSKQPKSLFVQPSLCRAIVGSRVGSLAAAIIIISSLAFCFVLSQKNIELRDELTLARRDIAASDVDNSVNINFYLKEHQDTIARYASNDLTVSQSLQMKINQENIMYYELFGNQSNSGMIINEPSSKQEIDSSGSSTISNGHALTFSEAQEMTDFDIVSPTWFHPCYMLSQLRIIEGRDALQLLYTNGINSISLFEQSLNGQKGLSHNDFREYAVYNNQGESGGTILAWRDDTLSYVLIGNIELSQLMDMAQSINARK